MICKLSTSVQRLSVPFVGFPSIIGIIVWQHKLNPPWVFARQWYHCMVASSSGRQYGIYHLHSLRLCFDLLPFLKVRYTFPSDARKARQHPSYVTVGCCAYFNRQLLARVGRDQSYLGGTAYSYVEAPLGHHSSDAS